MIVSFSGKYAFLSNFYPSVVEYEGLFFPTVEHAFQAAKTHNRSQRVEIQHAPTPGEAKRLGRSVKLRRDWDYVRLEIMEHLLRKKFFSDTEESEKLLAQLMETYPERLIEGNSWNDTFWGKVWVGQAWRGDNHLGRLLMKLRRQAFRSDLS